MKKTIGLTVFVLLFIILTLNAANTTFYGNVRTGIWLQMYNKDYNDFEYGIRHNRTNLNYGLYNNSRIGFKFDNNKVSANLEFGINTSNVSLRKAYGKYDFGNYSLLIGQDYSGFCPIINQVASENSMSGDMMLFKYGAAYDGRSPMIKYKSSSGLYLILMPPIKIDPYNSSDGIDALFPKINVGYKYKIGSGFIHPSLGLAVSKYNDKFSDYDDFVSAYVFALTYSSSFKELKFLVQINYGQNTGNYGIKSKTNSEITLKGDDIENTTSYGGVIQLDYHKTILGAGYYQSNNSTMIKSDDSAFGVFINRSFKPFTDLIITPEIGMIDEMYDGNGLDQGSWFYGGLRLRVNFGSK